MVVQVGKVIKNHRMVHLKWLNFMVCKVYRDEAVIKKKRNATSLAATPLPNLLSRRLE